MPHIWIKFNRTPPAQPPSIQQAGTSVHPIPPPKRMRGRDGKHYWFYQDVHPTRMDDVLRAHAKDESIPVDDA